MNHRSSYSIPGQGISPLVVAIVAALGLSPLASISVQAEPAEQHAASSTRHYNISAGPLNTVLTRFSEASGIFIAGDLALAQDKSSPGLQGEYSVEDALQRLLGGSGLTAIPQSDGAYALAQLERAAVLPEVKVSSHALHETGSGPVDGYVAKRSLTAGKADIPLIETPQSVNVITADQIAIQNAESVHQVFKYTPGITPMGSDNTTSDGIIIRGFNATGTGPYYLNGSKLARNTFSGVAEPYAMERIEILKGPASVLYGNAAPGGIINMVSKLPQTEYQAELKVQGGSFDRKQLAGDLTGSLAEDGTLAARVTGLVRRSDTMTDYVPDDRNFLQTSLRWAPTEDTSLTLLASYQKNDSAYVYGLPPQGTVQGNPNGDIPRERFVGEPAYNKFEVENLSLGYLFSHRLNDNITFRQNLLSYDANTDYADIWIGALDVSQQVISRGAYARVDDNETFSVDNQLEIHWQHGAIQHTTLFGVDYAKGELERAQYNGTVAGLNLYFPEYGSPVTQSPVPNQHWREQTNQLGLYVQDHLKIDGRWVIMVGGRHDKVKADEDDLLSQESGKLYDDSATTGRAGLVYLFDNGFAPYVSYSESFQPTSGRDVNDHAFKPTEGQQYELGMRYQPTDTDLMVTASVYQLTQTNVTTTDLNNPGESVQEGQVESTGFELEAKAKLAHNLNLIASYGYIDNAVTKSNTGTEGNRFGAVPRNAATLWADYDISQVLGLGAGIRYFGDSTNLANTYDVPSFTLVDAVINYRFSPDMDLALNLNNVFDKEYVTCSYACFYGVERSVVATATFRW